MIHIPIHSIHHDPDYFDQPEQFIPERFLPENRNHHSHAFITFGSGPRICIGMSWALVISKLALFHTICNFKFSTIPGNTVSKIFYYKLYLIFIKYNLEFAKI